MITQTLRCSQEKKNWTTEHLSGYHTETIIKSQQINRYAHHEYIYIYITVRKINYASREL